MILPDSSGAQYISIITRIRVRKGDLFPRHIYPWLLQMSLPQISRFIGESYYRLEIQELLGELSGISLLEAALFKNLARTYRNVLTLTTGGLGTLTRQYLSRWDIVNVMAILRGSGSGIPESSLHNVIVPAGTFDEKFLMVLAREPDLGRRVRHLSEWYLYPVLETFQGSPTGKGSLSRLENDLFKEFYRSLLSTAGSGIRGGTELGTYLKFEIDIVNIRNLFRLRSGRTSGDISGYLIPGGNIKARSLMQIFSSGSREYLFEVLEKMGFFPILTEALQRVSGDRTIGRNDVEELIAHRWDQKKTPLFHVVTAVSRLRLQKLESLSRRYPFTVLPIISYLEEKRYEVNNIRAIVRGKEWDLPQDFIRKYLVL